MNNEKLKIYYMGQKVAELTSEETKECCNSVLHKFIDALLEGRLSTDDVKIHH